MKIELENVYKLDYDGETYPSDLIADVEVKTYEVLEVRDGQTVKVVTEYGSWPVRLRRTNAIALILRLIGITWYKFGEVWAENHNIIKGTMFTIYTGERKLKYFKETTKE